MILHIKVKPGSKQNRLIVKNNEIVCSVKAPPVEGKANEELIKYLAELFNVSKSSVMLLKGSESRFKKIEINCPEALISSILDRFKA